MPETHHIPLISMQKIVIALKRFFFFLRKVKLNVFFKWIRVIRKIAINLVAIGEIKLKYCLLTREAIFIYSKIILFFDKTQNNIAFDAVNSIYQNQSKLQNMKIQKR